MSLEEIESFTEDNDLEIEILSEPDYKTAILGLSDDNRVIYDYDLMVKCLMKEDGITSEEAIDFIEYNTMRALSYRDANKRPIILYTKEY